MAVIALGQMLQEPIVVRMVRDTGLIATVAESGLGQLTRTTY